MALGEARANVTEKGKVMVTLAKAAGEIQSGPNVVMNLVQNLDKSEAWTQLMSRIQTFAKHADAKHRELLKSAISGKLEPQLVEGQVVDG
jgi:hypothetical protein